MPRWIRPTVPCEANLSSSERNPVLTIRTLAFQNAEWIARHL